MLKVLQLIPTLDRSGAEKQMVLLAKGLPRDRFHVEVAALTRLGPFEDELREAGIPVTLIGKPLKIDPFALARLIKFLRAKRFDVVQTWVFAANSYGRVAAHRAGVPVIVTAEMAVDLWKNRGHLAIDRFLALDRPSRRQLERRGQLLPQGRTSGIEARDDPFGNRWR